jgi:hypothetical protein
MPQLVALPPAATDHSTLWDTNPVLAAHCDLVDASTSLRIMLLAARSQKRLHFAAELERVIQTTDRVKSYLRTQVRASSTPMESTDDTSRTA